MKKQTIEIVAYPTVAEILQLFYNIKKSGRIFTAAFYKKDCTLRIMNCRTGVKKHCKGGSLGYNASSKGLLCVFDLQKEEYRMVNLNSLKWLIFDGKKYQFN